MASWQNVSKYCYITNYWFQLIECTLKDVFCVGWLFMLCNIYKTRWELCCGMVFIYIGKSRLRLHGRLHIRLLCSMKIKNCDSNFDKLYTGSKQYKILLLFHYNHWGCQSLQIYTDPHYTGCLSPAGQCELTDHPCTEFWTPANVPIITGAAVLHIKPVIYSVCTLLIIMGTFWCVAGWQCTVYISASRS